MDAELKIAYRTLSIYNFFLVQPFDFDVRRIRLTLDPFKAKKVIFWIATANAYFVTFYKLFLFFKTIFALIGRSGGKDVDQAHFTIHFVLLSGYVCVMFRIIVIYLVYPRVITSMFNHCAEYLMRKRQRSMGRRGKGSVFLLLVLGQLGLNSFFLLVYIFTCHASPQFIYAAVPDDYRFMWVQIGLGCVETYAFLYIVSMGFFVLLIQLLFFACVFDSYQRSIVRLR